MAVALLAYKCSVGAETLWRRISYVYRIQRAKQGDPQLEGHDWGQWGPPKVGVGERRDLMTGARELWWEAQRSMAMLAELSPKGRLAEMMLRCRLTGQRLHWPRDIDLTYQEAVELVDAGKEWLWWNLGDDAPFEMPAGVRDVLSP